ncbi:MAG TPA: phospholipid phosphatase [Clostridiales bacterium]|nr:phospholipid phosphatase [Clostridiales bacterium]
MNFQVEVIKFIQSFSNSFLDVFFEFLTLFGEETILVLLAAFIFLSVDKNKGYKLIFTIASGTCFNALIKNIVKFDRPIGIEGIVSNRVETATGYSFPSGHTQATSTFWTSLSIIVKNKSLYVFSAILITLVAISRLYLGVHWPTDVIFGALFGVLWAILIGKVFDYIQKNKNYKLLVGSSLVFVILTILLGDNDFYKSAGLLLGLSIGYVIEDKYVNLSIDMTKRNKSITYVVLIVGLLIIKSGLKLIFPQTLIFSMIRYFLVGFWAFGITPVIAIKLKKD